MLVWNYNREPCYAACVEDLVDKMLIGHMKFEGAEALAELLYASGNQLV